MRPFCQLLFQSNLRKQIRKLPKILQFVKIIHYYSELFTSLLNSYARISSRRELSMAGGALSAGRFLAAARRPRSEVNNSEY